MVSYSLQVPSEYGYVLLVAVSSVFINTLHTVITANARRKSGLAYPIAYASQEQAEKNPKAYAFNCAQRAHANYTDNLAPFLGGLLVSGLSYPVSSAALGAAWVVGRIWYAAGYAAAGPQGRVKGFFLSTIADAALKIMAVVAGVKMLPNV
ncbi:membrane-associated proteins in eicosanoid and glutathione metabolism [Durotheca rogersii]|uniref:membrane-associated proteins in eicosanoid and glutathione metabolism n=1 Tax=Durotheca rogersii TaxID=419775 RepID=UPI00221E9318|nr:membrane-associated proteins in eicosanoid and glutathione metabolism [Durotheca rogersii]KAI5856641.1 membrane-associated proteins in eicosanoid and glutathione metabolism [Durotheca rogersii]